MLYALEERTYNREDLQQELLKRIDNFNAGLSDVQANILHQPLSHLEKWMGGELFGSISRESVSAIWNNSVYHPAGIGTEYLRYYPGMDTQTDSRICLATSLWSNEATYYVASPARESVSDIDWRLVGIYTFVCCSCLHGRLADDYLVRAGTIFMVNGWVFIAVFIPGVYC